FAAREGAFPEESIDARDLAVADYNGDGHLDVVFSVRNGKPRYYQNDGDGVFTNVTDTLVDAEVIDAIGIASGDFDGDGDEDVFVPVFLGADVLLRNDDGHLKVAAGAVPADSAGDHCAAAGDVDGDGDPDLITGTWAADPSTTQRIERVLLNDGAGVFTELVGGFPELNERTAGCTLGDVDGDGNLDAVFINDEAQAIGVRLLRGQGDGTFVLADAKDLPDVGQTGRRPVLGDLEGDGDLDLFVVGPGADSVYLNTGEGRFLWASTVVGLATDQDYGSGVAAADVNRDGHLDLVIANEMAKNRLVFGMDGNLSRDASADLPEAVTDSRDVAVADFDGDGYPDLLFTNGATPSLLYFGQAR
ncbi:MAG: VCBS repeat-containing protein, partial [Myxococcales bacterium]|nr:VCBS repeat-containing protein [Myxococcales bacterium]